MSSLCGSSGAGSSGMRSATAITKVYGAGQKFIAVAVSYDSTIANASVKKTAFKVAGRTVTKVYANTKAALAAKGTDGRYVIVELDPDESDALLWVTDQGGGGSGSSRGGQKPSASGGPKPSPGAGPSGGAGGKIVAGNNTPGGTIKTAKGTVRQTGTLTTTDGTGIAASSAKLTTSKVVNLIVDDFQQLSYKDTVSGRTLKYNLFVPADYDDGKSYPLVLFMHDASVVNVATEGPLVQGLGAVCWAGPEDQARNECLVVAPEYQEVVLDDTYEPTDLFDTTAKLVKAVAKKYSVDSKRIYTTGQSMGGMMSIGLNVKYPDLFAAAFVVAGQWPDEQCDSLADKTQWFLASQDDSGAYPGQQAILKVIKAEGADITTAVWDATSTAAEFATDVRRVTAKSTPVNFTPLQSGTVQKATGGTTMAHMATWQVAYTIPGIRDWIMKQSQ
ncbi:alpha/beta hydrolase-fold protein [Streptomyces endophyticus]|uniref:Alpha/beta hydrolase-fold protein n=1 Tax=Streptomyces endophyticus TaxID=714166 RepID=A0ABU6F208_9ACTN|nr:PHB depolymerase family esterase [Streptomyces endophyticus]MEB8336946.1 alpha/beta hydrolase-fold protein [Streptomyces endophyticus]